MGYAEPTDVRIESKNLRFREIGNETQLWNKVMKEVGKKRYAGPHKKPPFEHYIQSPIGLVPKDNGKDTRLIFHLSHPRSKKSDVQTSINANTPQESCTVHYPDFIEAIQICIGIRKNGKMEKSDMSSAFRNLGMSQNSWNFLVMKARSPIDGEFYYFVDKCLPF